MTTGPEESSVLFFIAASKGREVPSENLISPERRPGETQGGDPYDSIGTDDI